VLHPGNLEHNLIEMPFVANARGKHICINLLAEVPGARGAHLMRRATKTSLLR
jgi:hypothetical protein